MTAEILSIIAVCISGITAICSATIPAILNFQAKKEELKAQKKREDQQIYEAKFEEFYQVHLKVLKDFSHLYEHWKINPKNSSEILGFIYEIAPEFRKSINNWLYKLADKIKNYEDGYDLDKDYNMCRLVILSSYGVKVSADTPNDFMSDILRVVLRERFDELQRTTSKDFKFHKD